MFVSRGWLVSWSLGHAEPGDLEDTPVETYRGVVQSRNVVEGSSVHSVLQGGATSSVSSKMTIKGEMEPR
ncbi:hypothetical protein RRG08_052915 [Elysia crispata]|uniref:Uncharacterized protein n=1 Tax=Elysia crispata TaxID=231223 RepID=A0AAE0Z8Y0_9GAST|nr:hypothetical protein RRG08_052915 [Elysia crispata]